jgi:molybdopterin-guanine dinucleotide biosynthesis protein A
MLKLDGTLMIGSASTNAGKTELACALLGRFGQKHDIVGIKVPTIKDKNKHSLPVSEGHGVLSSPGGNFSITEEFNNNSSKDTSRLLAAGAGRVFLIQTLKEHLLEAITALLDIIGPEAISICESNSLRQVIEPGLFLIVRNNDSDLWKNSARSIRQYADRIVVSNGNSFDLDLGRIKLVGGKWALIEKATAIIMAGGRSTRMGTDKSMLPIEGRPIIKGICERLSTCFEQILISADNKEKFEFLGCEVIPDKIPRQGPLMGIASALEASSNELNFIAACDIPHMELRHIRRIISEAADGEHDIVVPVAADGQYEPLFAIYRKSTLMAINKVLASGGRKISDVFALCNVKKIYLGADLVNLNTTAEYEEFLKKHQNQI